MKDACSTRQKRIAPFCESRTFSPRRRGRWAVEILLGAARERQTHVPEVMKLRSTEKIISGLIKGLGLILLGSGAESLT